MKFGKKLIIVMTIVSIVPSLVIAMVVNSHMQSFIHTLQKQSMESLTNVVAAHICDFYNEQEMDAQLFGQVTAFQKCLKVHGGWKDTEPPGYWDSQVAKLLGQSVAINDNMDGGALIDADGRIIVSYNKDEAGKSVKNTEMFKAIMNGGALFRNTVVNEDGSRNINLVVPVKDDSGNTLGMLKRVVNLSNINLYIDEVEIGYTGYIYIIDENATLIYHGSQNKLDLAVGEFQDRKELDNLLERITDNSLKEKKGIIRYDNQGVDTIAAYNQIEALGWVVVVAMDNGAVQGPIDQETRMIGFFSLIIGLITALCCYFIVQAMLLPIIDLRDKIKLIAAGNFKIRIDRIPSNEMGEIAEGIQDMAYKLEKGEEMLEWTRARDNLTGLYNRNGSLEVIGRHLHLKERQALMLIDLDEFGLLNDMVGGKVADGVLLEIAEILETLPENVRCKGRFSGDCFILMVESWNEKTDPAALAAGIRNGIEQIRFVEEKPVHLTASIGIAYVDDGDLDLDTYLKRCRAALHKAKNSGKNTDVVFNYDL